MAKPEVTKTRKRDGRKARKIAKKVGGKASVPVAKKETMIVLKHEDLTPEKFDDALRRLAPSRKKGADLRRFVGKVKMSGDPVEIQREMRRDGR